MKKKIEKDLQIYLGVLAVAVLLGFGIRILDNSTLSFIWSGFFTVWFLLGFSAVWQSCRLLNEKMELSEKIGGCLILSGFGLIAVYYLIKKETENG